MSSATRQRSTITSFPSSSSIRNTNTNGLTSNITPPSTTTTTMSTTNRLPSQNNNNTGLNLNYKSPQEAFNDALNFSEDENNNPMDDDSMKNCKMEKMMTTMLKNINDSKYIYPTISIVVLTILVIIILFQKISVGIKILSSVILLIFVAFSVFINKN